MPGQLTLLDAPSLWYRAFHGVPESVTAPDGSPVNCVRGTIDLIARRAGRVRVGRGRVGGVGAGGGGWGWGLGVGAGRMHRAHGTPAAIA